MEINLIKEFQSNKSNFTNEMLAILDDFIQITRLKNDGSIQALKKVKELATDRGGDLIPKKVFEEMISSSLKNKQYRVAMFNYMYSLFERHIHDLLRKSIVNIPNVKKKYMELLLEYDSQEIKKGKPSIRNSEYESLDARERSIFIVKYLKEVSQMMPPLHNWEFLFSIGEKRMWEDKNLKFDFSEVRTRRNLLTHRGILYDAEYVHQLKNSVKNTKNSINPRIRIQQYFKDNFFVTADFKLQDRDQLDILIKYPFEIKEGAKADLRALPVSIGVSYFVHCFGLFSYIYILLWNHSVGDSGLVNNFAYELLCKGRQYKSTQLLFLVKKLIKAHLDDENNADDKNEYFLKANYLLANRELGNIHVGSNGVSQSNQENEYLEAIKSNPDPIYRVLEFILINDYDSAVLALKNVKNLGDYSKDMFLFLDLQDRDDFKEIVKNSHRKKDDSLNF